MAVYRGTITLQSHDHMPCFHNVTEGVKKVDLHSTLDKANRKGGGGQQNP